MAPGDRSVVQYGKSASSTVGFSGRLCDYLELTKESCRLSCLNRSLGKHEALSPMTIMSQFRML